MMFITACGGGGEEPAQTTLGPPTTLMASSTTPTEPSTTPASTTKTTVGSVVTSTTTTSPAPPVTVPQPSVPTGSIPADDEATACEAIQARLEKYLEIAEESGVNGLLSLQMGLEEFEHEIDSISQQQDWGLQMLEQIYQVRREWSTAYSAHESGDMAAAEEHFDKAAGYMEAALAVPCP